MEYADKYFNTCKTDVPIWEITFCNPFDFKPDGDARDNNTLNKYAIVSIGYGRETLHKKYPDISSITFWNNGKPIYIQTLTLDRAKDKGYYDSSGKYKADFIKETDKKYHTHFYEAIKK